jgi:hypothetical protein
MSDSDDYSLLLFVPFCFIIYFDNSSESTAWTHLPLTCLWLFWLAIITHAASATTAAANAAKTHIRRVSL